MRLKRLAWLILCVGSGLILALNCGEDCTDNPVGGNDITPPARVATLSTDSVTTTSALLTWITTGDDSITGNATSYDIRYSLQPDSLANWWDSLTVVVTDSIIPKKPGQRESLFVGDLLSDTLYYFGLIVLDEAGNRSALSNIDKVRTDSDSSLAISPYSLDFGVSETELLFIVTNRGDGELYWSVAGDQAWLDVNPTSGSSITAEMDIITVTVDRTVLNSGTYSGTVTVTSSTGDSRQVTVTVGIAEGSTLLISSSVLDFGSEYIEMEMFLTSVGSDTLGWTVSDNRSWITVAPIIGSTAVERDTIQVIVDRKGLAPGDYSGAVTVLPYEGDPQHVTVAMCRPESFVDPMLVVTPATLDYGDLETELDATITNCGDGILTWTINDTQPWISVSPNGGSTTNMELNTLSITVDRAGFSGGAYLDTITVMPGIGDPVEIMISFNVQPVLTVSPDTLDFGSTGIMGKLTITKGGDRQIRWGGEGNQGWIRVYPTWGVFVTEDTMTVTVDRLDLPPGEYSGMVTITSSGANPTTIPVFVTAGDWPIMGIDPIALDFRGAETELQFVITNSGSSPLLWTVMDDQSWISVNPAAGSTTTEDDTVVVTINRTGLADGEYSGRVTVTPSVGIPLDVEISMTTSIGPPYVIVHAGTFAMGGTSWNDLPDNVTLTHDFYLGQYEVTNQEYRDALHWANNQGYVTANSFMVRDNLDGSSVELIDLSNPRCGITFSNHRFSVKAGEEDHPVVAVSWYGAGSFCDWLSLQAGLPRAYDHSDWSCNGGNPYTATGYRLPTEAEWEYAAQYGHGGIYPTGNTYYRNCSTANTAYLEWHEETIPCVGSTTPVGRYRPAPRVLMLYDLFGNVWEWCGDYYIHHPAGFTAIDPYGALPEPEGKRCIRGGCYTTVNEFWGRHIRDRKDPSDLGNGDGFRIARTRW